jgi:hypothetical protein
MGLLRETMKKLRIFNYNKIKFHEFQENSTEMMEIKLSSEYLVFNSQNRLNFKGYVIVQVNLI